MSKRVVETARAPERGGSASDDPHSPSRKQVRRQRVPRSSSPSRASSLRGGQLEADELGEFRAWIEDSAQEELPVRGAGAAKRVTDGDLPMFRDGLARLRGFPLRASCVAASPGETHRASATHMKWSSASLATRDMLRSVEAVSLPRLTDPPLVALKEQTLVQQLLSDVKAFGQGDRHVTSAPLEPADNQPVSSRDQDRSPTRDIAIPDTVFYKSNSFVGHVHVDLSSWACLCGHADMRIEDQIAHNLTNECEQLCLRGLKGGGNANMFRHLLQNCQRLHSLDLSRCDLISKAAVTGLAVRCPQLESLSLSDNDSLTDDVLSAVLAALPRLKSLDVSRCPRITDAGIRRIAKQGVLIDRLRLDGCSLVTDNALLALIKARGPDLRVLSTGNAHRLQSSTLKDLFVLHPKKLEELNLSGCVKLADPCFEYMTTVPSYFGNRVAPGYHSMQIIDVSDCSLLTSLSCCFIAASCPFLLSFRGARCTLLCDKAVTALASLSRLEELDLAGCYKITDIAMHTFLLSDGLQRNPEASPALKSKAMKRLCFVDCVNLGQSTLEAIYQSSSTSLVALDISGIGDCPTPVIVKLVKACRSLRELRCRRHRAVTRVVVAHLATTNKVLELLDLRQSPAIDDVALYPLAIMQSLKDLRVSGATDAGSASLSPKGLANLPPSIKLLTLVGFSSTQLNDDGCASLLASGRLQRLEELSMLACPGISSIAVDRILKACMYLRSLNIDRCDSVKITQLARALKEDGYQKSTAFCLSKILHASRQTRYYVEVIEDPCSHFRGIAPVDKESGRRAREREVLFLHEEIRQRAATTIQVRFRSRARAVWKAKEKAQQQWHEHCAAIDIQRVYRGYTCRRRYEFVRNQVTRAVVYLQYLWRRKLQQRRIRRATSYWTNQIVLKTFILWKNTYISAKFERERLRAAQRAVKALKFWGEKTVGRVFVAWRTLVQRRTVKAKKAIGFWRCQSLPRVLDVWSQYTHKQRRHRQLLVHVFLNVVDLETHNTSRQLTNVAMANFKAKRVVLRRWNEFVVDQKRFLLKTSLSILSGSLSHWSFRQWKQNVQQQRVLRDKHCRLVQKMINRSLYRVWLAWLAFVHDQRNKRRALLKFSNSMQAKCWLRWKSFHDENQRLKRVSSRIAARLMQQQLVRAVATWHEFTQDEIYSRQRMRRALAFFTNATLVRTFHAWADLTASIIALRNRWKARLTNANVHYAFSQWVAYTSIRKRLHAHATQIQAFWRGHACRRQVEDHYYYLVWATVLIQTAWRGRLARAILRVATRKARLKEYLRAERERDAMEAEEMLMRRFDREIAMIVMLQRMWRGVAARVLFVEVRRAKYVLKKQQEAETQEIIRAQARQRQLERIQREKQRQLAAVEIQRHIRGYLARKFFKTKREVLRQQRYAVRVQAVYRGRMSRRRTAALRRSYLTRMEILTRRAIEGKLLRTMGAKTRSTQRPLRSFLAFFGLDPATFLTDIRDLLREVREDFVTLKQFFDVVRTKVNANSRKMIESNDLSKQNPPQSTSNTKSLLNGRPSLNIVKRTNTARRFLKNFEEIITTTTVEKQRADELVQRGDAVRIVLRGHPRCGETAFVLGITEEIAQVKLDVDGELEFFPLQLPATKVESARRVLHKIPDMAFEASSTLGRNRQISQLWRDQLEAYAKSIEDEAKRFNAARVIQCAARVYLSRMRIQAELELQGVHAARRQQALLRVLQTFKLANTRIANVLVQLHFINPLHVPKQGLTDEPLELQKIIDRFQRFVARRREIHQAMLRLLPEEFKGEGAFQGGIMPVPPARVIDKLVFYPLRWLQRVTRVPMARMLEKRGQFEFAQFLGGAEFMKTFEEQHIEAHEVFFEQLAGCSFCPSEGWTLVHGVFQKREIGTDSAYADENRMRKKSKKSTRKVPHGWGVAHFLTGSVGGKKYQRSWLQRNSIEAQFKSLTIVKAIKQQEREERLNTQILARQGTMNTLRSMEGARGYAKRHAELSLLEEKTQVFYARYVKEITLREREEALLFQEEKKVLAVIEKEKAELHGQGQHLHELQQQVPEVVTDVHFMATAKTPLEFLNVGVHFEVEYDDQEWYRCEILSLDVYDTLIAEVVYIEDQRKEKIKLVPAAVLEEHMQFQAQNQRVKRPRTVADITAAAAARVANNEIPFRQWRAGKAVEIAWDAPHDNGAPVSQYIVEWKDDADQTISGSSLVSSSNIHVSDDESFEAPATITTLWPILPQCESTLRVRVAAENQKGIGLASIFVSPPLELLSDVNSRNAVPLVRPEPDTRPSEKRERELMGAEENASREYCRELTCTICGDNFPTCEELHEHVARSHSVPLICPFKSCRQVCASERALRYHIWRCSIPKPTAEEEQSEIFMEIFNISRQYCMRKDRRHVGRLKQSSNNAENDYGDSTMSAAVAEEVFLEAKYEDARSAWLDKARAIHEANLRKNRRDRQRVVDNKYVPPKPLYGLDFVDPELDVARREAVLATIKMLQQDLDAFRTETNTKLDKLRHEEKELVEYIALKTKRMKNTEEEWQKQSLKREKKKAQKTLNGVQANLQSLITSSTQRIEEMMAEINRLTVIERAFVPFTHQVIRVNRLGSVIQSTYAKSQSIMEMHRVILDNYQEDLRKLMQRAMTEVETLDAWDAMIEARRRQLQALKDELRRLQMVHLAEAQSFKQKRDDGDEEFQLTKLRQQQAAVLQRREVAMQALLAMTKKQTRGDLARTRQALVEAESTDLATEIATSLQSLHIANHDMQMHERFIKGKSAHAEYLKDADGEVDNVGGGRALVAAVTTAEGPTEVATSGGESTTEPKQQLEEEEALVVVPKKKRTKRRLLSELPHSYVRLECEFQDGMVRGLVRIEYNDGSVYEGPWVEDSTYNERANAEPLKTRYAPNHWGKFTFHDGTVWQGEDVDNFFSPFTATGSNFQVATADGHEYTGDVRAGKFHGFGTLKMNYTFSKGEYVGEWCEGTRQGYGIERFDNGEIYEGYWELDLYHGHGEMVYDDGSRYEGYFKHGKWHGEGVRTLENGDKVIGIFSEGFLNGSGIMEFADKRHYVGEFKNTRRHGQGSLTFANGDRYEGPFVEDEIHGEGKMITKSVTGGEPLVRLGKWEHGERVAWLSKPSTQLATATFIQYFAVVKNVSGEIEMDLLPPKFQTPYAVMVAGMLPNLPDGVDGSDPFVQSIVRMLAKTQNVVVGAEILEKTVAEHAQAAQATVVRREEYERIRNEVDLVEREARTQLRRVNELQEELGDKTAKEQEMQVKVENFWKYQDKQQLERKYKQAVDELNKCDVMDWYKLRTANLDDVYMSLLEAFAILLNFTTNFYLDGKMYQPTREDIVMLLSSNEENVHMGDKEGLIHRYNVKALYVLPLFDAYSFGEGVRNQMLHSITHVIHHPRLRPNNVRLYQISPGFAAVCTWVRAAFFYAKKAIEICPVVKRMMEQLVIVEHVRVTLENERGVLKKLQGDVDDARGRLEMKRVELEASENKQRDLAKIIQDIEALDAAEHTPMEKQRIRKPQTFRPPSASIAKKEDDQVDEDETEEGAKEKVEREKAAAAAAAQVNRRQVFEEDHGDTDVQRVKKEQVLGKIVEDVELAQEFELMKKEVRKVIDRCGGKVAIDDFPARFEEIMLKSLNPMLFGIKKMRTLLLLMEDVCTIVEPQNEGEVETVQFPTEPDDVPMVPRQKCFCRVCPGVSYGTPEELLYHERTKWHHWNLVAKREGREPMKYTLAATYWTEAYDSSDNTICYYNKMTGEVVKGGEPPLEMQADELMMELLTEGEIKHDSEAEEMLEGDVGGDDDWEEVADDAGNVYFYNRITTESSWTRPGDVANALGEDRAVLDESVDVE